MPTDTRTHPILVTGSHRSGTTWVGRMLCLSDRLSYIHEPFNLDHHHGTCAAPVRYWFTYVNRDNEAAFAPALARTLGFHYDIWGHLKKTRTLHDIGRLRSHLRSFRQARERAARPVMKDPLALFSSEWLAQRFGMDVIVIIRHPAAFVSSVVKIGWGHDFNHFLAQPALMREYLAPYADTVRDYAARERPLIDQVILLWNLIHHTISILQERHPEWAFVRHEDLSRDPESGFKDLFDHIGEEMTEDVRQGILAHTGGGNPADPAGIHDVRRDSLKNLYNWKRRLSADEIEKIRERTAEVAARFYTDKDWEAPSTPA
ncbi:MAG: sulfotransferase [Leptospirillia bacterium]